MAMPSSCSGISWPSHRMAHVQVSEQVDCLVCTMYALHHWQKLNSMRLLQGAPHCCCGDQPRYLHMSGKCLRSLACRLSLGRIMPQYSGLTSSAHLHIVTVQSPRTHKVLVHLRRFLSLGARRLSATQCIICSLAPAHA